MPAHKNILFLGTLEEKEEYTKTLKGGITNFSKLKECVGGDTNVYMKFEPVLTFAEIEMHCAEKNITAVMTTSQQLLEKLVQSNVTPKIDNYAGSLFKKNSLEILIINPIEHLRTVRYGKFLMTRFISKLTNPEKWRIQSEFKWDILGANNIDNIFDEFGSADLLAVDIETERANLGITCIGWTAVYFDGNNIRTHSVVLPVESVWSVAWMRKFNNLPAPKIFQGGKYDIAYLSRWNAVPYNWLWDTMTMFHSWYSEMPKDLGFLTAFFVRDTIYWKDLAQTTDKKEYYKYNALDNFGTALSALAWFLEAPTWAKKNYLLEFPLNYPCHLTEMTGVKRDMEVLKTARAEVDAKLEAANRSLNLMLGTTDKLNAGPKKLRGFNVNSTVHMRNLARVLGFGKWETTRGIKTYVPVPSMDDKACKRYSFSHPFNGRILEKILEIRKIRKLISTYLRTDDDADKDGEGGSKEFFNRILYGLHPHGTDSGRLASREHHFWCGLQIQNINRGPAVKQTVVADDEFLFAEVDLEQAESRDTGYIAGDEKIIERVSGIRDFHTLNVADFTGQQYEILYDDITKKSKNKELRDIFKRVNHGANYNMGANVLMDTMGLKELEKARKLLKLPAKLTHKQIAEYLLEGFHKMYPNLKGTYYPWIIAQILKTKLLIGATGWTRYCFGDPVNNKHDLNSYISHPPQSLNAQVLNKAYLKVFYEIALDSRYSNNFKLGPQIHDSILFQLRKGHEYICQMVKERMEIPVTVKGADGKTRTFIVPAAIKAGKDGKGVKYWSETE